MDAGSWKNIDTKTLAYGVASSILFAVIAKWSGVWRRASEFRARSKGLRRYRFEVRDAVSKTTVVGRREGFQLEHVYVDLDLAPSDLMQSAAETSARSRPDCFVLLGGPGAGKSTYVKRQVMRRVGTHGIPFYVRLRDYNGDEALDDLLASRLIRLGIGRAEVELDALIVIRGTLIVLDGLDEVRVASRHRVCERINAFYQKYFAATSNSASELIVTCRKEAYRDIPLDIPFIWEVRPLSDEQIQRFAERWPLSYPDGKSAQKFWDDLQAVPKILELARSPLLLVGGLMQYSESNLGIPEERFQYVARIAKWLIAEWAAAQTLPPDPLRPLYDRLLPRLAFAMHHGAVAELSFEAATQLFADWLPQYGARSSDAATVLDSISMRTGILVRDIPGTVVFAQFSLQEYFASTVLARSDALAEVIRAGVSTWWREAVLLAIAQIEEPTSILQQLFKSAPAIAAEGVAECPTPSLEMQEQAADACVMSVDAGDEAAQRATVALLRKISMTPGLRLARALEERLRRGGEIGSAVGLILAHAGTETATKLLAAHPDVWERCLRKAGYLSNSFEQVLVGVISDGNPEQFQRATRLLIPRLSQDRLKQLLGLLDRLEESRAADLAEMLLDEVAGDRRRRLGQPNLIDLSRCAVRVKRANIQHDSLTGGHSPSLAAIAVALAQSNNIRDPQRLATILDRGARWWEDRRALARAFASCLVMLSFLAGRSVDWRITFIVGVTIAVVFGFPLRARFRYRLTMPPGEASYLVAVAFGAMLVFGFVGTDAFKKMVPDRIALSIVSFVLCWSVAITVGQYMRDVVFPSKAAVRGVVAVYLGWFFCTGAYTFAVVNNGSAGGHLGWLALPLVMINLLLWFAVRHGVDANRFRRAVEISQEELTSRRYGVVE